MDRVGAGKRSPKQQAGDSNTDRDEGNGDVELTLLEGKCADRSIVARRVGMPRWRRAALVRGAAFVLLIAYIAQMQRGSTSERNVASEAAATVHVAAAGSSSDARSTAAPVRAATTPTGQKNAWRGRATAQNAPIYFQPASSLKQRHVSLVAPSLCACCARLAPSAAAAGCAPPRCREPRARARVPLRYRVI